MQTQLHVDDMSRRENTIFKNLTTNPNNDFEKNLEFIMSCDTSKHNWNTKNTLGETIPMIAVKAGIKIGVK